MDKLPTPAPSAPPAQRQPTAQEAQVETTLEKMQRKFSAEPFIPIGTLLTVGFLGAGLRAFHSGKSRTAQYLMRGRVLAQGFTVAVFLAGSFMGLVNKGERQTYEGKLLDEKMSAAPAPPKHG